MYQVSQLTHDYAMCFYAITNNYSAPMMIVCRKKWCEN